MSLLAWFRSLLPTAAVPDERDQAHVSPRLAQAQAVERWQRELREELRALEAERRVLREERHERHVQHEQQHERGEAHHRFGKTA